MTVIGNVSLTWQVTSSSNQPNEAKSLGETMNLPASPLADAN
jgi:hypothetical protein